MPKHTTKPFEPTRDDYEPLAMGVDEADAIEYLEKVYEEHQEGSLTMLMTDILAGAFTVQADVGPMVTAGDLSPSHFSAAIVHLAEEASIEVMRRFEAGELTL